MRIVQVVPRFPPAIGGMENHVYSLSVELGKRGHQLIVITSNDVEKGKQPEVQSNETMEGIEVHRHPLLLSKRMREYWYLSNVIADLQNTKPDIVHTNGYRCLCSYVATSWCRKHGIPAVHTPHGIYPPRSFANHLIKSIYDHSLGSLLLRYSTKITALTRNNKQLLRELGVPENKIVIIPNGVNIAKFDQPTTARQEPNHKVLLYVGRIDWNKGLENVIRALPALRREFGEMKFVIVGPDYSGYLKRLVDLARRLDVLDSVVITGEVSEEQKLDYYSQASVFILPALYEGLSVSLLEAMASRIPVVSTKFGGPGDVLVDHVHALLLGKCSSGEISDSVGELLSNPELAWKIRENAYCLISKDFSLSKVVDKIEALYTESLKIETA